MSIKPDWQVEHKVWFVLQVLELAHLVSAIFQFAGIKATQFMVDKVVGEIKKAVDKVAVWAIILVLIISPIYMKFQDGDGFLTGGEFVKNASKSAYMYLCVYAKQ